MDGEGAQQLFDMFQVFARYGASTQTFPTRFVDAKGELDLGNIAQMVEEVRNIKENIIQESPSLVESAHIPYGGSNGFHVDTIEKSTRKE